MMTPDERTMIDALTYIAKADRATDMKLAALNALETVARRAGGCEIESCPDAYGCVCKTAKCYGRCELA